MTRHSPPHRISTYIVAPVARDIFCDDNAGVRFDDCSSSEETSFVKRVELPPVVVVDVDVGVGVAVAADVALSGVSASDNACCLL